MNGDVSRYLYDFGPADYYVIIAYLIMLVGIGFAVKKLCGGVSDFFVGGRKMPWWLAGAGCFMSSFSAWTFTGAAGFAYQHGVLMIVLFFCNVLAYLFAGRFVAAKCRQTGQMTAAQIVYDRFGRLGEQFFLWIQVPNMIFGGAIWMMGLATFLSVAFGVPMNATILVSGVVILVYSTISGSWAVTVSAFLQSLILLVLTVAVFMLTLGKIGGISGLLESVDPAKLTLFKGEHTVMWVLAYFSQLFLVFNSVVGATRFLSVPDGRSARKAAYFAAFLFLIGPVIWLIPPIAASYLFPDLAGMLPGLKHPQDAAYVVMGLEVLPHGLAGLLVMVIFAATLSSMDAAINQNAGIVTLNIYKPLFRPGAGERELFIASRVFNLLCGTGVTAGALFLAQQEQFALFDLMLILSALGALPIAVPFMLMYWIKRTPRWSAVVSIICGGVYSLTALVQDWSLASRVFGTIVCSGSAFLFSTLYWKYVSEEVRESINTFYLRMNTPIESDGASGRGNVQQLLLVGTMAMMVAAGLFVVVLFPNTLRARGIIGMTAFVIFAVGWLMRRAGKS